MIMISLYNTLKESLLGGFDEIEASTDPIKEIEQFIKANFNINGKLQISKKPNKNGKYEVNCKSVEAENTKITSLTNNMFEWDEISDFFDCSFCDLKSLEGAPKKVSGDFNCSECDFLTSLEGAPEEVGQNFDCSYCNSLTSLKGAPKEIDEGFNCAHCYSLKTLEGAPKYVGGSFSCFWCKSLTSLEGAPEEVGGSFFCHRCKSLTSLKGAPKKVGEDFSCFGCKQDFTEDDVRKICKVKVFIHTI